MKRRDRTPTGPVPVAQYIRMSTEHQRFSPDNQRVAIEAYAKVHGFEVVASYQDSGKSGLTLSGRPELKRLLSDVLTGSMPYKAILVLDVTRWGRFQDADQAAHYEFMCREAGVPVRYCCEAFDHDGGAMASIVKHMKRVMAAEYSRELSTKVSRAQRQQAGLGYKQGGCAVFGTRRQVVDVNGRPKMMLGSGERKALSTDKVLFVPGPAREVALVRRIFRMYVTEGLEIEEISSQLAKRRGSSDKLTWTRRRVSKLLRNEIYVGTYVYGRRNNNLGAPTKAPSAEWIRAAVFNPIVPVSIFEAAAAKLDRTARRYVPDEELTEGLLRLYQHEGFISHSLIRACPYLPGPEVFVRRYGSLEAACRLIGHAKPKYSRRGGHQRRYSDQDLVDELRRIVAERGHISRKVIDEDARTPPGTYFMKRLGGIVKASALAGAPYTKIRKKAHDRTDAHHLALLRELFVKRGYLSEALIDADPELLASGSYRQKFGGLPRAYALVGFCGTKSQVMKAAFDRKRARPSCDLATNSGTNETAG